MGLLDFKFGGGDEPKPKRSLYKSREEINRDNQFLRDFLARRNVQGFLLQNSVTGRNIGDTKPIWEYQGAQMSQRPQLTELPMGVGLKDIELTKDGYGFWHPQSGNFVPVNMEAITMKYGRPKPTK